VVLNYEGETAKKNQMTDSVLLKTSPLILTSYRNGEMKLHDYSANLEVAKFSHHSKRSDHFPPVVSIDIHPNDLYFVSSSLDGSYNFWDIRNNSGPMYSCENYDRAFELNSNCKFTPKDKVLGITSAKVCV
jgi:WD40 repeat protein